MQEKSKKAKTIDPSKAKTGEPKITQFPIVCVGASAGGLEALEQFFGNVPPDSGMGYVVIQHLDPTQKGMLPELLQRITPTASSRRSSARDRKKKSIGNRKPRNSTGSNK